MLIREIKESINSSRALSSLIVIIIIFMSTFFMLSLNSAIDYKQSSENYTSKVNDNNLYKLIDTLQNEEEALFLSRLDSVDILKNIYNSLNNNKKINTLFIYSQGIGVEAGTTDEKFGLHYEEGDKSEKYQLTPKEKRYFKQNKALQIDYNLLKYSDITVSEGRNFKKSDFEYLKKTTPILLGSEYKKHFKINDIVEIDYLFKTMNAKVIGFVQEDTTVILGNSENYKLNRYIIFPAFKNADTATNEDDFFFQQCHFLNMISPYIISSEPEGKVNDIVKDIMDKENFKWYQLGGVEQYFAANVLSGIKENQGILYAVTGIFFLISCTALSIIMLMKLELNNKKYRLHFLCGAKIKDVTKYLFFELMLLVSAPILLAALIMNSLYGQFTGMQIILILLYTTLLIFIPMLFTLNGIKKIMIQHFTEGEI